MPTNLSNTRVRSACALAVAVLVSCSTSSPETRIVERAAAALGGMTRIQGVTSLSIEGSGEAFALGQNRTLDSELLKWQVTNYERQMRFDRPQWREESVHTPTFLTGWPDPFRVVAAIDGAVAFDVEDGTTTRLDSVAARDRRAELYHHPIGFLRAATADGARLEHGRHEGGQDAVDLVISSGERFTLFLDGGSHLPTRIVSTGYEPAVGDVAIVTTFGAFTEVGGLKLPTRVTRSVDGKVVADIRIAKTSVNPHVRELDAPAEARAATPAVPHVTAEEAAPGIWYLAGEGHHSILVEFADHLTLIEAPIGDDRTLAVLARARALRPGKPVTEVINTHHHFDHSGGIRAAISEGLTVITHEANRGFFEDVARRPSTVVRDALARHPKPLSLVTVADRKVLTDGRRSIEIYAITGSAHCAAMLMVYFPAERLLVEADLYQPPSAGIPPPKFHPYAANLLENIERRRLRVDRILPIHGRIAPFADLVAAARSKAI